MKLQRGEEFVSSAGVGGTLCTEESIQSHDKELQNPQLQLSSSSVVVGLQCTASAQAARRAGPWESSKIRKRSSQKKQLLWGLLEALEKSWPSSRAERAGRSLSQAEV